MGVVGSSVIRKDALAKVKGLAKYVGDMFLPGMAYVKTVRSPYARAKILSIKKAKAEQLKGVLKVITASDIPGKNIIPLVKMDEPVLAEKEVRFYGEPVALVVAETKAAAERGAEKVEVEYEELEPLLDPELAIEPSTEQIHPEGNILSQYVVYKGDVEKGFEEAAVIVEDRYEVNYQEHAYLEPQGMLAVPNEDGSVTVYGSMQCPFYVHDAVAMALGINKNMVRIVQTTTGGGFGGKEDVPSIVGAHAALAAYLTGRPCKLIYTREEDIISMSKRHPGVAYYKLGVAEDGRITAIKVKYILNGGAYATLSPVVLWRGTVHAGGPYKCDNVHIETYAARTNTVPNGAYRGFGTPQILFAVEQQIDRAAEKLGISPAKIREINGLKVGDETITGHKLRNSTGYINTLKKVVEESNFDQVFDFENYKKQEGPIVRGIGIGSLIYGVGLGAGGKKLARAGAFVEVLGDGSAVFAVGTTEMGQGEITVLSQITADALGIKYEKVRMLDVDTTRVPDSGPTVASRATVMSGNAIIDAATKIKKRIFMVAAEMLGIEEVDVEADDGVIFSKTDPNKKLTYEEVVQECMLRRVHLAEQGWYIAPHTSFNEKNGQGDAYFTYTFATNVAEVAVDIETGEIRVEKLYSAYDIKPVNPQQVEGQIEGGTTQAMGYALYENMVLDGGKILTNTFSTYTIPTVKEMPEIKSYTVPAEFPDGPFGAKGFGETPMMAVAPAIANAIYNATGVRITRLPITPELFLKKLKEARETK